MSERININGINFKIDNCPSKEVQQQASAIMRKILNKNNYLTVIDAIYKPEIANLPENKELLEVLNEVISIAGIEYIALYLISFRHKKKQVTGINSNNDKNGKFQNKEK